MTDKTSLLLIAKDKYTSALNLAKEGAALNGEMGDGGHGIGMKLLHAYEDGVAGRVPSFLEEYYGKAEREADPEWESYSRLHAKFEGAKP